LTFNPSSGNNARVFLYGNSVTVASLSSSGAGSAAIANGNRATGAGIAVPPATLTVNQSGNTSFAGLLADTVLEYSSTGSNGQGSLSLIKSGGGTLTLSGSNAYSGITTVSGGTLSISSDANLGTAPASPTPGKLVLNGGTLQAAATFTLSSNRGIALGPT